MQKFFVYFVANTEYCDLENKDLKNKQSQEVQKKNWRTTNIIFFKNPCEDLLVQFLSLIICRLTE